MPALLAQLDPSLSHVGLYLVFLVAISAPVAFGVTVMYHRVLTHRSARISRWIAYPLVTVAAPAGTPVGWVGNHRHHHRTTDTVDDPHSPTHRGLWVAHAGWYLGTDRPWLCALYSVGGPLRMVFDACWRSRTGQEYAHLAPDVAADPYYRRLGRPGPYALVVLGQVAVTWGVAFAVFGWWALPGLYVLQVAYYAVGDGVNSLTHRFGRRPLRSDDDSTNLAWLAALTAGDGFHQNHHVFPWSIRHGLLPGQIDLAHGFVRALAAVGLASHLREPRPEAVLERLLDTPFNNAHYRPGLESRVARAEHAGTCDADAVHSMAPASPIPASPESVMAARRNPPRRHH